MRRRAALLALASPLRARAQGAPPPAARPRGEFWFDPTQLPSFTGTVERYLPNPRGETDALIFREGPQIVFPPDIADAVKQAAPPRPPPGARGLPAPHPAARPQPGL